MHGIPGGDDPQFVGLATSAVTSSLKRALSKEEDLKSVKKTARSALLSILWERTNQRPMVIVSIITL